MQDQNKDIYDRIQSKLRIIEKSIKQRTNIKQNQIIISIVRAIELIIKFVDKNPPPKINQLQAPLKVNNLIHSLAQKIKIKLQQKDQIISQLKKQNKLLYARISCLNNVNALENEASNQPMTLYQLEIQKEHLYKKYQSISSSQRSFGMKKVKTQKCILLHRDNVKKEYNRVKKRAQKMMNDLK